MVMEGGSPQATIEPSNRKANPKSSKGYHSGLFFIKFSL